MISQFTWPNFRSGSDKDACKVIIDEYKFTNDVKYGKTKIFIRTPQTLFALERARNQLLPGIVTLIQKTWRGYVVRQQYKRMKALMTMIKVYRRKKIRQYINELEFKFRRAKSMKDFGKSILWPAPPLSMRSVTKILRNVYNRYVLMFIYLSVQFTVNLSEICYNHSKIHNPIA